MDYPLLDALRGNQVPRLPKRARDSSDSDSNDEPQLKRTSMPDILNPILSSIQPTSSAPNSWQSSPTLNVTSPPPLFEPRTSSLPPVLNHTSSVALSTSSTLILPAILNHTSSSAPSTANAPTLPPISIILQEAGAAELRATVPHLPPATARVSIQYLASNRSSPPVSLTRTPGPTVRLELNVPYQPSPPNKMSISYITNGPTLAPIITKLEVDRLTINPYTVKDFNDLDHEELLEFDCIEVIAPVTVRARVAFKNHFETITFDLSKLPDGSFYQVAAQAGWLICTSDCAKQLIVKDKLDRSSRGDGVITPFDFREVQRCLGFRPKARAEEDGMYFVWKRDTRADLIWTW